MIRSLFYTTLLVWWIVFIDIIQAADTDIVSHTVRRKQGLSDEQFQKKTVAYWTPERRKAAKPPKGQGGISYLNRPTSRFSPRTTIFPSENCLLM